MLIALISDMHLFHWDYLINDPRHPLFRCQQEFEINKPDLIIDAGDYEMSYNFGINTLRIKGNHDYYGKSWDDGGISEMKTYEILNPPLKIVMATLWSDFNGNDPGIRNLVERCLNDCTCISGFSGVKCFEAFKLHSDFLLKNGKDADIIVTHHSPSFKSVHPMYLVDIYGKPLSKDDPKYWINYGFSSELEWMVEELAPKYWIFGHQHTSSDFYIGKTRMINNPCGYPSEYTVPYKPVYITL